MPLYFAYGSNMDLPSMRDRCPGARPIGPASLAGHRFALMGRSGYATVRPDTGTIVYGLLFELAETDIAPLDEYEDLASGLYTKTFHTVALVGVDTRVDALVYIGVDETDHGVPPPGYMELIAAAARAADLPAGYIGQLASLIPS